MKKNKSIKYVCVKCGFDNVEQMCWVNMNTGKVMNKVEDSLVELRVWCNVCDEYTQTRETNNE